MDDPKYFYYQFFRNNLAQTSTQSFDDRDPSIGRVVAGRFFPPTVKSFKSALCDLENYACCSVISFLLSRDSPPEGLADDVVLSTEQGAPGTSPRRPFTIMLAIWDNGTANVALSPTEPGFAVDSRCPRGWATCVITSSWDGALLRTVSGINAIHTEVHIPVQNSVYYQVIENGLARISLQSFDDRDPSIGRIATSRLFPSTVKTFKSALYSLEGIRSSRIISFLLTRNSSESLSDTVPLSAENNATLGASPLCPFTILVTQMEDGVADVALSSGEPGKANSSDCPEGWGTCVVGPPEKGTWTRLRTLTGINLLDTGIKIHGAQSFFYANLKKPVVLLANAKPGKYIQVLLPEDRMVGFYYQIIENGVGLASRQSFDDRDPSIGRLAASRLFPSTVESLKNALWGLEDIHSSRIISFLLTRTGSEDLSDNVPLFAESNTAFGASPSHPFTILVTRLENGVADVAVSPSDAGLAVSSECPIGWAHCMLGRTEKNGWTPLRTRNGIHLVETGVMIHGAQSFFYADLQRPVVLIVNAKPARYAQVLLPEDRRVGYVPLGLLVLIPGAEKTEKKPGMQNGYAD
ncbi:hypothetical protein DL93DRAFT_2167762 [Clavulina sp. PMI_390]|nr:hypothetical protein DL93DRAFT_2167762 [Clavulina sp. PMI_390]